MLQRRSVIEIKTLQRHGGTSRLAVPSSRAPRIKRFGQPTDVTIKIRTVVTFIRRLVIAKRRDVYSLLRFLNRAAARAADQTRMTKKFFKGFSRRNYVPMYKFEI